MIDQNSKQILGEISRGALPFWVAQNLSAPALLLVPKEEDVADVAEHIESMFKLPKTVVITKPFQVGAYVEDSAPDRQRALVNWLKGEFLLLVASKEGLRLTCDSKENLLKRTTKIKPGTTMGRRTFEDALGRAAYGRVDRVEQVGEYAIRGDVTDIWVPGHDQPRRILWNFDTVEAIRPINVYTQRSEDFERDITLYPVTAGESAQLLDILPSGMDLILYDWDEAIPELRAGWGRVTQLNPQPQEANKGFQDPPPFVGQMERLREQLELWHEQDWTVYLFCHNQGERDRLEELLEEAGGAVPFEKRPWVPNFIIGNLEHGFVYTESRLAVLTNSEIFGRKRKRVRLPKFEGGDALKSVLELNKNDFLVHEKHGLGRYLGLQTLDVGGISSEFLSIEYKGGDKVYVPIFEIQQVQKYMGAEGKRPALSSLDTAAWERIKSKVKEDVAKLAAELLRKAAKRTVRPGHSFPGVSHLENEFAQSFMYELTPDQKKTWEEVEGDMMAPRAMDRLVCGDVGYGKTEIAMRAALKCGLSGKQVAVLCPTTILAEQHFRNFSDRFADYPVTVKLLSRFQTKKDQVEVVKGISSGGVDIIIGTHRLLSKDISFRDLGLIIIDEEHRFGVRQKSKLLSLRETTDVLSLTATPIPRTLASSLGGIKSLSVIETPPVGRLPISTYVGLFNEDTMVKAVQNELDRGGQVFYVHNRVKTLESRRDWIKSVLPEIRIAMAHGQMLEHQLEDAMHKFLHRKVDVLLATTIIESGLDIPSVNTLIIEEAEEMGLSQLYQLRGRVGRSSKKAYCYLFYNSLSMTSDAKKRLEALKEYTALGSGFRLAMRDMEIRGAGNLLGPQQHGNMAAVGIETYSRLLNEEIQRLKGQAVDDFQEGPLLEMAMSAYLPDDYMPSETERVQMYKRVLSADEPGLAKLKDELVDRCGTLPPPAKMLFDAAALRLKAGDRGVSEVHQGQDHIVVYFRTKFKMPEKPFQKLMNASGEELELIPGPPMGVRVYLKEDEEESYLDALGRFLRFVFDSEPDK